MTKTTSLDKPKYDAGFSWCLHALNNHAPTNFYSYSQVFWLKMQNIGQKSQNLPWWPKQLPWTSLRMMLDFPEACMPWIIMPPLVGRSDDKCSRTSRKSHFRPTNVVLDMDGTSKNRGLSGQFSLLKAGKIKNMDILLDLFLQALTNPVPKIHFISILGGARLW